MHTRSAGLTLLELLVALALFGALAAIALPDLRRTLAAWRLNAAARQVVMDLKLTRAQAIAAGVTQRLRFTAAAGRYQRERQSGGSYVAVGPPTALPDGVIVADCSAAGSGISFRPRGLAATFGTITLRDVDGVERRIVVDIAGRLRLA
ncbi:MAG: GspH/FimT family protein [Deltaproteobacteria bacterium]|nr:GspH/FimT family protein [Deltaproteobacteria bacterium]